MAMQTKNSQHCHFLDLNYDCISVICNNLTVIDWCSLRKASKRVQAITDDYFKERFLGISLPIYDTISANNFRLVIQNFGQFCWTITINGRSGTIDFDRSRVIKLLDRYCISLKKLKIVEIEVDAATIIQCKRLFYHLEHLVIDKRIVNDQTLVAYLNNSPSLKQFEITQLPNIRWLTAQHFYSLELLSINEIENFDLSCFQRFVEQNSQLKALKIVSLNCPYAPANEILQLISYNLSNLKVLSMNLWQNKGNLTYLHSPRLKKLEIDSNFDGISSFFNELAYYNQIQRLHLIGFKIIYDSVNALCNLKSLKLLKFTSTYNLEATAFKQMASGLPALLEVHIIRCLNTKFIDINEFVKNSINLKKIVFVYHCVDNLPCLTKGVFLILVASRLLNSNPETLNIFLDYLQHNEVIWQFVLENCLNLLTENVSVINLLRLKGQNELGIYTW